MNEVLDELTLIRQIKAAREKAKELKDLAVQAADEVDKAEGKLIEFMTDRGIKSTARYEGIGFASLEKPELFARCNKPDMERLFEFIKSIGREDLIKPSVHHSTLSSFVGEMLEKGENIPEFIQYGFKQTLRICKA